MPAIIDRSTMECVDISKYIKCDDLKGKDLKVVIEGVEVEDIALPGKRAEPTPVIYFRGGHKPLIPNTTNLRTIRGMYGKKVSDWVGREIVLYPATTSMGRKKNVPCIRIREIDPGQQPEPTAKPVSDAEALKIQVTEALEARGIPMNKEAIAALREAMKTTALGNLKPDERKQMFADIAAGKFDHLKEEAV
jgi:hypothetical protein